MSYERSMQNTYSKYNYYNEQTMNVIARGPPLIELCNLFFDLFDAAYMVAVPGGEGDQHVLIGLVDCDDRSSTAMTAVSSLAAVAEIYPNLKPLIEGAALQEKCKWHPLSMPHATKIKADT